MFARHPRTGATIRVIKSDSSVWRDSKTLIWLDGTEPESLAWDRYEIGASSLEAWTALHSKYSISALVLLGDLDACEAWMRAGNAKTVQVLVVPKALLLKIGYADLIKLRIGNMLCIDEALEMYPFLEASWDGSEDDARLITALVLRFGMTAPIRTVAAHTKVAATLGLKTAQETLCPPKLALITQYYVPDKKRRANEIDLCLKRNTECRYIDKVILLNESMLALPVKSDKIYQANVGGRLRFDTVFKWIYDNGEPNTNYVIANSDIYMDDSLRVLWSVNMKDRFLSLLRWDDSDNTDEEPKLFGPRADSQDTWIVSSDSVKSRTWDWVSLNIPFGKGGCDNAINVEMLRQKFLVVNPCLSLMTHHVHNSAYRTYDPKDIVDKPVYMHVNPTGIHDLNPVANLPGPAFKTLTVNASVPILNGPSSQQKETFYTMLERAKVLNKSDGIVVGDRKIPLYKFSNVIESYDGLISTYDSIYIGGSKTASDAWSAKQMNVVSSCVEVDLALVAYLPDEIAKDPYRYMLEYLGKILVLQAEAKGGEFLATNTEKSKEVLNLFNWKQPTIPVLARDVGFQAWCKHAYVWYPRDAPESLVTPQEITALRDAFQFKWDSTPSEEGRIVCLVDGAWITEKLVGDLEKELGGDDMQFVSVRPTDTLVELAQKFNGATGMLTFAENPLNALSWLLPNRAKVWEIQSEMKPSASLLHLANVAGLRHTLHIVARQSPQNDIEKGIILTAMCKAIGGLVLKAAPAAAPAALPVPPPQKPIILMPAFNLEGFFAHAGDSFREIVKMWGERKYVGVKEGPVNNIWFGNTLLYDRPTLQWLEATPKAELEKAKAPGLFGNPAPPSGGKAWSFWPRRPRIVEELVGRGITSKTFEERNLGTVFYGRSENAVQKANRTAYDWSSACDDYVHLEGSTDPYPYTHREYLERLSRARWGLCLAGFGKKCHREIECMAMGCVPVVAPEVDMENYADPPVEGLHYIRVESPTAMAIRLKEISPEDWQKMSNTCKAWWAKNSSVKGLWELTERLCA